jgi:hypothetical protein
VLHDAALWILGLPLERTHVAPVSNRFTGSQGRANKSRFAALVGLQRFALRTDAVVRRNHVNGDADDGLSQQRMRHGRSAVVGKLAEVQLLYGDVDPIGPIWIWIEIARIARGLDVEAEGDSLAGHLFRGIK